MPRVVAGSSLFDIETASGLVEAEKTMISQTRCMSGVPKRFQTVAGGRQTGVLKWLRAMAGSAVRPCWIYNIYIYICADGASWSGHTKLLHLSLSYFGRLVPLEHVHSLQAAEGDRVDI